MDFSIRPIQPGDNPILAKIIRDTLVEFKAAHPGTVYYDASTDSLYDIFLEKKSAYFVAIVNNEIVGGAGLFPTPDLPTATCELVKMYLLPQARGKGLGKYLITHVLDVATQLGYQQVYLETMPELKNALKTYEQYGFTYLPGPLGNSGHTGCSIWMLKKL